MKKSLSSFLLLLFFLWSSHLCAQDFLNKDSLVADFTYLIKALEQTHPDPYSGFGGKVFFHKSAFDLKNELTRKDFTVGQFADKVLEFLAHIEDGHTLLHAPKKEEKVAKYLPVRTRVITGDLILVKLPEADSALLGSRVVSINGVSLDSLLYRTSRVFPCENIYGQYNILSSYINHYTFLNGLLPSLCDTVTLKINTPDDVVKELQLPFVSIEEYRQYPLAQPPVWDKMASPDCMYYTFLDEGKETMLFKLTQVNARENFQFMMEKKWNGAYDQMKGFYKWTLKKEMPQDTVKAIADIPSFSETFLSMLKEMKKHCSQRLIIDLRNNGGGWTPITLPGLYMLYGDKYLNTDMGVNFYRLLSPLYLEKTKTKLDDYRNMFGRELKMGDYLFREEKEETGKPDIATVREGFIANSFCAVKPELRKQNGEAVYTPTEVYVVTDPYTFSAAFHFAFYLKRMGAVLVGVPSSQAPNTFMELTPFQLPYTRLEGSISNSMQVFLPAKDDRAKIFWPDIVMRYEDYRKYDFDSHSEIRYLLESRNLPSVTPLK